MRQNSYGPLNEAEHRIIVECDTEMPHTGRYDSCFETGLYACRQCAAPLFRSDDKFNCGCGWPGFEDALKGAVKSLPDPDGRRVEVRCATCGAHLGHLFMNEGLTPKNVRYCINSLSLVFEGIESTVLNRVLVAGGCFWGVEYWMRRIPGVLLVTSGYSDGEGEYPDYQSVCAHEGHFAETAEVIFDPRIVSAETVLKRFLEIHDPSQRDGQGSDLGSNYRSGIYVYTQAQFETATALLNILRGKGLEVSTGLEFAKRFWPAEAYHQNHYEHEGTLPYCHTPVERF